MGMNMYKTEGVLRMSAESSQTTPASLDGDEAVDSDAVRYAKGIILTDDDESHMSDLSAFRQSGVPDPGAMVAGITIVKK